MTIKINYLKKTSKDLSGNIILFVDEKFKTANLGKFISKQELHYIDELLKTSNLNKNILVYDLSSKKKIVLISIKKNIKNFEIENLGAELFKCVDQEKKKEFFISSDSLITKNKNFLGHFLHGLKLRSYIFDKYKTKKKNSKIIILNVVGDKNIPSKNILLKFKGLEEGTFYARDLVSEPGNILHPDEYAKRLNSLSKDGLKITIFNEKKLKKLGMNSLLGVGMGSVRGSYLVIMEWKGAKNKSKPFYLEIEEILSKKYAVKHLDDFYKSNYKSDIFFEYYKSDKKAMNKFGMEISDELEHRFDIFKVVNKNAKK